MFSIWSSLQACNFFHHLCHMLWSHLADQWLKKKCKNILVFTQFPISLYTHEGAQACVNTELYHRSSRLLHKQSKVKYETVFNIYCVWWYESQPFTCCKNCLIVFANWTMFGHNINWRFPDTTAVSSVSLIMFPLKLARAPSLLDWADSWWVVWTPGEIGPQQDRKTFHFPSPRLFCQPRLKSVVNKPHRWRTHWSHWSLKRWFSKKLCWVEST